MFPQQQTKSAAGRATSSVFPTRIAAWTEAGDARHHLEQCFQGQLQQKSGQLSDTLGEYAAGEKAKMRRWSRTGELGEDGITKTR